MLFGVLVKESREGQARVGFTEQSRVYDPKYFQEGFPLSNPRKLEEGRNFWSDYSLGRPPEAYSSIGFAPLGLVFRHAFGHSPSALLWERILEPIGFSGVSYHYPPPGIHRWVTHGGMCRTPRDYARFAYLILRQGRWKDQQIVDPE